MIIKKTLSLVVFFAFFILASISPIFGAIPLSGNIFDVHIEALDESIPTIEDSPILPELPVIVDEDVMPVPYAYYDYDNDGKTDLVRKEVDGNYYVYKNKGTNENQAFREGTKINNVEGNNLIENYAPKTTSSVTGTASPQAWLYFDHARYDLYIDDAYYNANGNGPLLDDFFNEFDERYALLESTTGWSSEEYSVFGTKLKINLTATTGACYGGSAYLGNANIRFSNPLYMSGCEMAYYENGVPHFGNPGELEDNWSYMTATIHESLHAINPSAVISRTWLTEGFSRYYEYNILSNYNGNGFTDINQETTNTYIYNGDPSWNWPSYIANDYHDTTPQNLEIQSSKGYDITAWMFSMMRDNHSLSWNNFYTLIENNRETIDQAFSLASAPDEDMFVIDLFGRASGLDFETQTKPIWRYDGPSGPGWGVRNWEPLDWYADLRIPYLNFSDTNGNIFYMGENVTINANVSNTGQVNLQGVVVKIYEGANLLKEQIIDINAGAIIPISANFYSSTASSYNIKVVADEEDIKIELNDLNNENTKVLSFQPAKCGDLDNSGAIDILDVVNIVNVAFRGQTQGNNPSWVWNVNGDVNGAIDIIDVVKIVNVAFRGANEATELTCNQPAPNTQASTTITLQKTSGGFSASASIDRNVAGMQFDLSYDSSKVKISGVKTATRTSGMTITNTQISAEKNRIAIYSDNGEKFIKAGSGTLFTVQATGNDFSSLNIIPAVVDYKTSNGFSNVKVSYKLGGTTKTSIATKTITLSSGNLN